MYNKFQKLYEVIIDEYLRNSLSIRKIAKKYGLHYQTVFKWIKKYKKFGENYPFIYHKPWNRLSTRIEFLAIKDKERYPGLTLKQAQRLLAKRKINISNAEIWNIWKRNGYAGFDSTKFSNDFTELITLTKESQLKLIQAQKFYEKGLIKESARVLNSIPALPKNDIILKIPDEFLNTRRKIEKLVMQFGTIPLKDFLVKAIKLYQNCQKNHWNYSALRIGMALLVALSWYGKPEKFIKWTKKIESLIPNTTKRSRDLFPLYFTLQILKCHISMLILKVRNAFRTARYCYRLISQHKKPLYDFLYDLAIEFIDLEDYKTAEKLLKKALEGVDLTRQKRAKTLLAVYIHLFRNDKEGVQKLLKEGEIYDWAKDAQLSRFQSLLALIEGRPSEALTLAQKALDASKQAGLNIDIINAYFAMASASMCLGEEKKAKELLNIQRSFLRKNKIQRQLIITNILLGKIPQNEDILKLSSVKLVWILKNQGYIAGYEYAKRKGILFYFYRYLFFFPEIVQKRIEKNKPTFLPKAILKLPIFNSEALTYRINFLGKLTVYRNQKYLKVHLSPKDTGVLLYVINQIKEPENFLNLSKVYTNFWQKSSKPARIFSHCLVRIKKALDIPGTYLEVRRTMGEPVLVNNNIYFTTDYQEFEQTIARAKALQRAGEWEFAKKEFLQAFKLFRGEPFKKNFDDWSVDMRFRILTELETEAINFAKACLEHNDKHNSKKVLEKVLKIIPDSEGVKNLLDSFMVG
jgi:transposase